MNVRSFFLLLATGLTALQPVVRADEARNNRWKQDVAFLSTELPQRHGNLFYVLPREQFEQSVSELMQAIPALSDAEIITGMARIVAMAQDAHTTLALTQSRTGFRALPLTFYWFQDGLFVIAAAPEHRQALAARVVQIGDKTADEAYQLVTPLISHENDAWVRAQSPGCLILPDVLQALKITATAGPVRFVFEDAAHNRFPLDVDYGPGAAMVAAPDSNGFVPLYLRNTSKAYWFTYVREIRTLYFKYNRCREDPSSPFAAFLEQLFSVFDANPVDRLVVDLRNNDGGDASVLEPFLNGLGARQARFLTTRLNLLFNRNTFSSAMLNAWEIQTARDQAISLGLPEAQAARLLGEPTGGNPTVPWRNGDTLMLPNSGLAVGYTTSFRTTMYKPGSAVEPDVLTPVYSSDWFSRHDPVLSAALADCDAARPQLDSAVAVLNGASYRPGAPVAPGSLASAFGDFSRADSGDATTIPLPSRLGETQLLVNDVPAPLLAVRPSQINFQVPSGTAPGIANLQVLRAGNPIAAGRFDISATGPGIFTTDLMNPARPGAILNQDNRLNAADTPARAGEIIQIYATGQGGTQPAATDGAPGPMSPLAQTTVAPQVYIGTAPAKVMFTGLSTVFPGLWQLNVKAPSGLAAGQTPVFVISGPAASNPVTLWMAAQ